MPVTRIRVRPLYTIYKHLQLVSSVVVDNSDDLQDRGRWGVLQGTYSLCRRYVRIDRIYRVGDRKCPVAILSYGIQFPVYEATKTEFAAYEGIDNGQVYASNSLNTPSLWSK